MSNIIYGSNVSKIWHMFAIDLPQMRMTGVYTQLRYSFTTYMQHDPCDVQVLEV